MNYKRFKQIWDRFFNEDGSPVDLTPKTQEDCPTQVQSHLCSARTCKSCRGEDMHEWLYKAGICPSCGSENHHHIEEPFASCDCCTREDTSGPGTIQQLRIEIASLKEKLSKREVFDINDELLAERMAKESNFNVYPEIGTYDRLHKKKVEFFAKLIEKARSEEEPSTPYSKLLELKTKENEELKFLISEVIETQLVTSACKKDLQKAIE